MFSFHKPKVYRSPTGCCICKAKSSSSRFTDSKKYEDDFIECFQLEERRNGEICNACVLLVKRWKKLPAGSNRNWRHVVDARAGPGIKSLTKFKSKNKKKLADNLEKIEKIMKKKHVYLKPDRYREQSPAMSDDLAEEYAASPGSKGSSRAGSPAGSDDAILGDKRLNRESTPSDEHDVAVHGWIDLTYFKRELICCGTIFKGPYGEVIIDPSLLKPCLGCTARQRTQRERRADAVLGSPSPGSASASPSHSSASASPAHSVESISSGTEATLAKPIGKTFSDSSSDSGYDESSNPGIGESRLAKISENGDATKEAVTGERHQQRRSIVKILQPVIESPQSRNSSVVAKTCGSKVNLPIKLLPTKIEIEGLTCKTLSLAVVPSGNATLGNAAPGPVATVMPSNPLVDFAIHASARRSIAD